MALLLFNKCLLTNSLPIFYVNDSRFNAVDSSRAITRLNTGGKHGDMQASHPLVSLIMSQTGPETITLHTSTVFIGMGLVNGTACNEPKRKVSQNYHSSLLRIPVMSVNYVALGLSVGQREHYLTLCLLLWQIIDSFNGWPNERILRSIWRLKLGNTRTLN
jgi:hypothetical protein